MLETKKITANEAIQKMIRYINADQPKLFYEIAELYAKGLSPTGSIAREIKWLVSKRPKKLILLESLSHDVKKLILRSEEKNDYVFIPNTTKSLLDELLIEWKNVDAFRHHNLPIRNKILLHGITGNGKTTIARHIAKLAELPFVEIKSDLVISSSIGSSGKNIDRIFNQIQEPCVLFWDEVDTIGRKRGNSQETAAGVENERMVNSVLVNIEKLSNDVIFVGATNRKDVLDSAFLRRFDILHEILPPTDQQKNVFSQNLVEYFNLPDEYLKLNHSDLISYSEIKSRMVDNARKRVLQNLINL